MSYLIRNFSFVWAVFLIFIASTLLILRQEPSEAAWIAFVSERSGGFDLFRTTPHGTHTQQLTSGLNINAPVYAPDGQSIAVIGITQGNHGVYLLPAEGGSPRLLTDALYYEQNVVWSADGQWLYFQAAIDNQWQTYGVRRDGSALHVVPDNAFRYARVSISLDGRYEAQTRRNHDNLDIYVQDIGHQQPAHQLTRHPANDNQPTWSPTLDRRWHAWLLLVGGLILAFLSGLKINQGVTP